MKQESPRGAIDWVLKSEITGSQTTTYTYDGQDQLIGVLPHSGVLSTYTFDGDGPRRTAQDGNVVETSSPFPPQSHGCGPR